MGALHQCPPACQSASQMDQTFCTAKMKQLILGMFDHMNEHDTGQRNTCYLELCENNHRCSGNHTTKVIAHSYEQCRIYI